MKGRQVLTQLAFPGVTIWNQGYVSSHSMMEESTAAGTAKLMLCSDRQQPQTNDGCAADYSTSSVFSSAQKSRLCLELLWSEPRKKDIKQNLAVCIYNTIYSPDSSSSISEKIKQNHEAMAQFLNKEKIYILQSLQCSEKNCVVRNPKISKFRADKERSSRKLLYTISHDICTSNTLKQTI